MGKIVLGYNLYPSPKLALTDLLDMFFLFVLFSVKTNYNLCVLNTVTIYEFTTMIFVKIYDNMRSCFGFVNTRNKPTLGISVSPFFSFSCKGFHHKIAKK